MAEIRRGTREINLGAQDAKEVRISPTASKQLSNIRKQMLNRDVENGIVIEAGKNYNGSMLKKENVKTNITNPDLPNIGRGNWDEQLGDRSVSRGSGNVSKYLKKTAQGVVAHSMSFKKQSSISTTSNSSGYSGGSQTDRLAPEVYSPLFTMANLNLPRDRITVNAWVRNFFDLHPIVRNCITLHATYPISKLNIRCSDSKVEQFFGDMVEEMDLLGTLGDLSLEFWKLGEKVQGNSLITMSNGSLRPISEIKIGDEVLTHLGNKKRVVNTFMKPTNKVIEEHLKIHKIYVEGLSHPLVISGKHPILSTKSEVFQCSTPSCKEKNMRILPGQEKCSNCGKKYDNNSFPDFIETNNIKEKDIVYAPFNKDEHGDTEKIFTPDFCYLIGYWLAEGCYCKDSKRNKYDGIKFTSYDGNFLDNCIEPIIKEYTSFVGKKYISKSSNFVVGKDKFDYWFQAEKRKGPQMANFFLEHCGEYSKTKQMSKTIMELSPELQKYILAGFIDGDGCIDKSNGHIILATSSLNLANQFLLLLRRIGLHPTMSKVEPMVLNISTKYRIKIVANEAFDTFKSLLRSEKKDALRKTKWACPHSTLLKNWQLLKIKKIEDITDNFSEEYMYDIEVEDDHSYVANGIAIHNCFPHAILDENEKKWKTINILNPDFVHVKKAAIGGYPIITLRPDEGLKRLVMSSHPADQHIRSQIPEEVVHHVRMGQNIPLDNFNISHLKMLSSPYDTRGTSIVVSCFKDLMLYDKLRECYSDDTEFLTESGFKKYEDITENDKLGTMNPKTNQLEYQNYSERIQYHYEGEMYHFFGKKVDMLVTPNHRMWLSQSKSHGGYFDFDFIKAKDVKPGYIYKARNVIEWRGEDIKNVNILGQNISIEEYLELLGYLIAEGCIYDSENNWEDGKKKRYDRLVGLCQSEKSSHCSKMQSSMEKLASLLNMKLHYRDKINTPWDNKEENRSDSYLMKYWTICNKELTKYFSEEIGSGSHNKKIPRWVKELSPRLLNILLKAMVSGDGTIFEPNGIRKNSIAYRYTTISKQLSDDVQEILFKCGYSPRTIFTKNNNGTDYYSIAWSESDYGKFPTIYGNKKDNNNGGGATFNKVNYKDNVSCFTVPNSLLITRRNGKITIQGNCKFAQADGMINPITLVKVGGNAEGEARLTSEDLEEWRQIFEEAQYDKDFKIITHAGVTVERVGSSGQIVDTAGDIELIVKNIYTGLMVPQAVVDTESAVYSSASIGLEVLRQRYFNFRNLIAKWLVNKIFAPICKMRGFFEYKDGEKKLIVPEIEWNHMNLYDMSDYIQTTTGLLSTQQCSLQTIYRSLGLNYEEEKRKQREEMIDTAKKQREEQALTKYTLEELRSMDPSKEIQEAPEGAREEFAATTPMGGGMGPEAGMLGGGGIPGGGMPGMEGGMGELAPPPGGEFGGGAPGAGAPPGGGVTPGMGPGAAPPM